MGYSVQCVFISRRCCCAETSEGGGGRNRVGLTGCGRSWELDGGGLAGLYSKLGRGGQQGGRVVNLGVRVRDFFYASVRHYE